MEKIYIDFDGVLVDTPKYIKEEISKYGNNKNTFTNIKWDELLSKCNEICGNIKWIRKEYNSIDNRNYSISIITHYYSECELNNKKRFIRDNIGDIDIIFVPFYINKSDFVNAQKNLIVDDYKKTINLWRKKGGIGILYKNYMKLEDLLLDYIKEDCYGT